MKSLSIALMSLLVAGTASQAHADPAGMAAAQAGLMFSSAPLGSTFISSLGTSESSSGNRMKVAAKEDAALYVASNGAEERPALEAEYQRYLGAGQAPSISKMEFAVGLLAQL